MTQYTSLIITFILLYLSTTIQTQLVTLHKESLLYGSNYQPSITAPAVSLSIYIFLLLFSIPFTVWVAYHHGSNAHNIKHNLLSTNQQQWNIFDKLCSYRYFPYILTLVFNFIPFALYITAAIFDNWSYYNSTIDTGYHTYFGIQNTHVDTSGLNAVPANDYTPFCKSLNNTTRVNTLCGFIRFGAIITIVGYALALATYFISTVWLIIRHRKNVKSMRNNNIDNGVWSTRLLTVYHFNHTFQAWSLLGWSMCTHVSLESLMNTHNSELQFTYSWWFVLASTVFSFIPQLIARRSYMRHQYLFKQTDSNSDTNNLQQHNTYNNHNTSDTNKTVVTDYNNDKQFNNNNNNGQPFIV